MKAAKPDPWEELYRYWQSKIIDGRPPRRADLDPMIEIPHLAAHLLILDILPDGYRYRLAGSHLRSRLGEELTGTQVGRNTAAESQWLDLLDMVRREQKPVIVTSEMPAPSVTKRMGVVLPLIDRSGKTAQIIAGIFFGNDLVTGIRMGTIAVQALMDD
ncbi:MAG: hypothetical protein JWM91_303 [Rhodospirillales bacterium]|nr:hypothetical protein [Rhodospirillales bacterium]